ncbi:transglycosylase family protein [Streptomyces sp. NPDC019396]|uniref:transglycosylase family protein n=1 Tax=Streptomyces sp. NPDC019396 TaxID=3154687 RepID=UPI003403237F
MLSGNGRHRRPRQAPALFVAAGVTGSAIAIPLLGAGAASAADADTWNRVANCESGGAWSADYGNGYYGGLQLSQEDWEQHGGTTYAPRPDLASRSQQITVAEKVLAAEGSSAWESCATVTGLVKSATAPQVDPGGLGAQDQTLGSTGDSGEEADPPTFGDGADAATPEPSASTPAPASPASPGASTDASGSAEPPSGDDGTSESADASQGESSGTGKHRGTPANEDEAGKVDEPDDTDETGDSGDGREYDGHASRGDASARDVAGAPDEYTVRPGDSLSAIADAHEVPGGWPALYEGNRQVVGIDADLILPGQSLDLAPERE